MHEAKHSAGAYFYICLHYLLHSVAIGWYCTPIIQYLSDVIN